MGFSIDELLCVCISRKVKDGEVVAQGLATPIVAAAYLLAWHTHAPNLYFASAIGQSVCHQGAQVGIERIEELWLDKCLTSFGFIQAAADLLPRVRPKEFFRPGQVDSHGNFNNLAIGKEYRTPRLRLPGAGGIPDVTTFSNEIYLYVPRHSRATFVENLDFISGLGHSPIRKRGAGPRYLVSDLGQFDFKKGSMRLTHLHPGTSEEQVRANTGFNLEISPDLKITAPPSEHELDLIREKVDPLGVRKLELMSGATRRQALRIMLETERKAGKTFIGVLDDPIRRA